MYARIMDLKKVNPKLIILLAVGGWKHESGTTSPFSIMVNNDVNRGKFVKSVVKLLRNYKFDGFDLDWEFPGGRGNSPAKDKQMFTVLVKELSVAFEKDALESGKPALLLTAAVASAYDVVDAGYEPKELSKYLHLLHIMAYDLHGTWDKVTGHHAALKYDGGKSPKRKEYTVEYAVEHWIKKGFPPNKITLGLATYGRSFYLEDEDDHGLSVDIDISKKDDLAPKGAFTREAGLLAYYEICSMGLTVIQNNKAGAPYGYKKTVWVSYDDAISLTNKSQIIKDKNLAGAMFWALDMDDFNGKQCGQGRYPLLSAVKTALGGKIKTENLIPEETRSGEIVIPKPIYNGKCYAVGLWKGYPGMDIWCFINCPKGVCPVCACAC
ncbi:acidic mammalian chitinase isoform X2 [Hydra vulgaris]|uniref:Acidic mammalian chitinase isoform X2 n=1 Tax=Hydra vulgaris TaxID=6087 RepID=A0ABM4CMA2_HYDVU